MPNVKSAEKRLKTTQRDRLQNRGVRSEIRTSMRKVRTAPSREAAAAEIPNLFSLLDRAARRKQGSITKNTAANYKRKAHEALASKPS